MWRPDIVVVEKKNQNEMDRGTNYAARDYGGDELPNVFDGHHTKFTPRLTLSYSFPAALSSLSFFSTSSSFYAFTRILFYTTNIIPGIRRSECALPDPIPINSGLPTPPFVASPFVYPHLSSHYP